jgi:hypothetical protein
VLPLQNREHGANAFDPSNNKDNCFVSTASIVVPTDQIPGRDDRGPLGWRCCWSRLEVVNNHPEPTLCTPMRRNTMPAGGGASDVAGLAGQTSNSARCAVSSTRLWCLVGESAQNSAEFRKYSNFGPFELRNVHWNLIFPTIKFVPANS